MQLSSAVTLFQTEALEPNRYVGTCGIPVTHTHNFHSHGGSETLSAGIHYAFHNPARDQHRRRAPFKTWLKPSAARCSRQNQLPTDRLHCPCQLLKQQNNLQNNSIVTLAAGKSSNSCSNKNAISLWQTAFHKQ